MNGANLQIGSLSETAVSITTMFGLVTAGLVVWRRASKARLDGQEDADRGKGLALSADREKQTYQRVQEALDREQKALERDQASQAKNAQLLARVEVLTNQVELLRGELGRLRRTLRKVSPEYRAFVESGPGELEEPPSLPPLSEQQP